MNKDRLRRRVRPTTSCPVAQKAASVSDTGVSGTLSSSSSATDSTVQPSFYLPSVVSLSSRWIAYGIGMKLTNGWFWTKLKLKNISVNLT